MPVAAAGRPAAVATLAIVLVGLVMTWDALGLGFTAVLESKGLLLLVAVGFLVALGSFDGEAADVGGRRQLARAQAPAPPARLPDQEPLAQDVTAPSTSRQPVSAWRSGSGELVARSGGSGGALSSLGSASASASGRIKKSSSSLAVVGMTGRSGSSTALVPAADDSAALVEVTSLSCPRPGGCGFRHAAPDTGRWPAWMACDACNSRHAAPPPGSVWREDVDGHLRLLLSWEGAVLDVTAVGRCRGWDRELNAAVRELLESGKRPTGMCSRRRAFPMLQKGEELCRMDGRRIWSAFQRWLRGRQGGQAAQPPLALEMASRQLEGGT